MRSFMEGGLGTVRFGSNDSGLQLGRARFALTQPLGELWSAHLDASMFDDQDRSPARRDRGLPAVPPLSVRGLSLSPQGRRVLSAASRSRTAPPGWESPYTLSYSAINSWLAVEVRTIGLEGQLDWLGTRSGHAFDLGVTGGVFGWNEGAGVGARERRLLAHRPADAAVRPRRAARRRRRSTARSHSCSSITARASTPGSKRATSTAWCCACCATTTAPTRRRSTTSPTQSPGTRASPAPECASKATTAGRAIAQWLERRDHHRPAGAWR